jgi:hypothetical protein
MFPGWSAQDVQEFLTARDRLAAQVAHGLAYIEDIRGVSPPTRVVLCAVELFWMRLAQWNPVDRVSLWEECVCEACHIFQ